MIKKVLRWVLWITGVLTALITISMCSEVSLNLEIKRFYFEAYKAVGVGFLVALLAAIIPQMLQEARDQFERFKDSRIAYSHAKTSILYLPERLATLSFKEAVLVVQDAHEKLHLAETYKKELLKHLEWYPYPNIWSEQMYWELTAVKQMLQSNVDKWPDLTTGDRIRLLCDVLKKVRKIYEEEDGRRSKEDRESNVRQQIYSVPHS